MKVADSYDHDRVMHLLRRLRSIAADMNHIGNSNLQMTADHIAIIWKGSASGQFLGHCEETRIQIHNLVQKLSDAADLIEQSAVKTLTQEG